MQLRRLHKYHRIAAQVAEHHSQSTCSNTSQQLGVFRWVEDAQGISFGFLSFFSFLVFLSFFSFLVFFYCFLQVLGRQLLSAIFFVFSFLF